MPQAAKASAQKATVLTLRHLEKRLSAMHELSKRESNEVLGQVVEMITRS